MKIQKYYIFIFISLIIALFIYLFYRPTKTIINICFIKIFSLKIYLSLKKIIIKNIPLNKFIINSLPEGLWVFATTLSSKNFYLKIYKLNIQLIFIPIIFAIYLEISQLINITNGFFDWNDIFISIFFWLLAITFFENVNLKENIFKKISIKKIVCLLSYLIIYLAHFSK